MHQVQVGTHRAAKRGPELQAQSAPLDGASGGVNVPLLSLLGGEVFSVHPFPKISFKGAPEYRASQRGPSVPSLWYMVVLR